MLVTKTDVSYRARRCASPSINQPCCFQLHLFGKGWKSSKLLRNRCSLRLTYFGWIAGPRLHATNYLRRDPPTNSLTFCRHCFLFPAFLLLCFYICDNALFSKFIKMQKDSQKLMDRIAFFDKDKKFSLMCFFFFFLSHTHTHTHEHTHTHTQFILLGNIYALSRLLSR